MSRYLNNVAVTQFDKATKHEYQAMGALRGCFRTRTGVVGDKATFNKMGAGTAHQRGAPSSDVVPMGVGHSYEEAILTDWEAPEYTDLFGKQEVMIDEVNELATTTKGAIGRRRDQIAIDAMVAAPIGDLLGGALAGSSTEGMSLATLIQIKELMDDQEIPDGERFIAMTPNGFTGLLNETKITSSDYASVKALQEGTINTFLGFQFKRIGTNRAEGGLPLVSAGVQSAYAWDRRAVGEAIGLEMETSVEWSVDKQSWLSMGKFKGGACIADPLGVVRFQYKIV
jgi:hypothetical protein